MMVHVYENHLLFKLTKENQVCENKKRRFIMYKIALIGRSGLY